MESLLVPTQITVSGNACDPVRGDVELSLRLEFDSTVNGEPTFSFLERAKRHFGN